MVVTARMSASCHMAGGDRYLLGHRRSLQGNFNSAKGGESSCRKIAQSLRYLPVPGPPTTRTFIFVRLGHVTRHAHSTAHSRSSLLYAPSWLILNQEQTARATFQKPHLRHVEARRKAVTSGSRWRSGGLQDMVWGKRQHLDGNPYWLQLYTLTVRWVHVDCHMG